MDTNGYGGIDLRPYWETYVQAASDEEVAFARLAGMVRCPGTAHKQDPPAPRCLICLNEGWVTTEGKSTDTIRFWISWAKKPLSVQEVNHAT